MSINLNIKATREVQVVKTGEVQTQTIYFNCQQTPTRVTDNIMNSSDKAVAYVDWILSQSNNEIDERYDDESMKIKNIDWSASHVKEFKRWLKKCNKEGYEVEYYAQ